MLVALNMTNPSQWSTRSALWKCHVAGKPPTKLLAMGKVVIFLTILKNSSLFLGNKKEMTSFLTRLEQAPQPSKSAQLSKSARPSSLHDHPSLHDRPSRRPGLLKFLCKALLQGKEKHLNMYVM